MKFYTFAEKLPCIGTNIILICDSNEPSIGICEVTAKSLHIMRYMGKFPGYISLDYYPQEFFCDDCTQNGTNDLQSARYWCYPSSLKVKPKKKGKK